MRARPGAAILLVALVALAFRVWLVVAVETREPTGGDPLYYHVQANLLADGHGYAEPFTWLERNDVVPSAVHPPAFATWLAAASIAGFRTVTAHKVMSALAGALAVLVIGLAARRLAGDAAGVAAAVIAAAHPNLWVVDGALMPESLFALAIAVVLLAAIARADRPTVRNAAVLGAAIGAATLVRSEALLLVPLLALHPWRRSTWAMVAAALAVIAPWTVRNLARFDAPVLLSVNGDEVLRNANCDSTWHGRLLGFWSLDCYQPAPPPALDEAERARFWRRAGLDYVRDHARRAPAVAAARLGRVWGVYRPSQTIELSTVEGRDLAASRAGAMAYLALLPLAAIGIVDLRRRHPDDADDPGHHAGAGHHADAGHADDAGHVDEAGHRADAGHPSRSHRRRVWPLAAMAVLTSAVAVYAYGVIRFRMAAEVAIVVAAGVGVAALVKRARRPR